ncbi:hypothetical protein BDV96DRAFT_387455 [Lophiotrema nucula]|uniref:Wax synthase domain-containing protein n=1 Tax=Lophiotrema nucula TaxID=690887 RepID=A0A6A5ZGY8_9PLEO|nr:hypothetical protein BDV96DRAFT_387455 [Lophiotrema nucula]
MSAPISLRHKHSSINFQNVDLLTQTHTLCLYLRAVLLAPLSRLPSFPSLPLPFFPRQYLMAPHSVPVLEDDVLHQLLTDLPPALISLAIPGFLMYLSLWAFAKRWRVVFVVLSVPTLVGFWVSGLVAPVRCAALKALLRFTVAAGTMKLLDVHALSLKSSFPSYSAGSPPRPSIMALILLTELRLESFTPNPIRHTPTPKFPPGTSTSFRESFYSEPVQLIVHLALFAILQVSPQFLWVKALGILFTIWILWTSCQLVLRYKTSPPLFGPIWRADSLAGFWVETWHNAFASPCLNLTYTPVFFILTKLGSPRAFARATAVVSGFGLMAWFHVYALEPLLSQEGKWRIGVFFIGNGIFTVVEVAIWGKKRHWLRALIAWAIELSLSSWAVAAIEVADGVLAADWRGLCRVPSAGR